MLKLHCLLNALVLDSLLWDLSQACIGAKADDKPPCKLLDPTQAASTEPYTCCA